MNQIHMQNVMVCIKTKIYHFKPEQGHTCIYIHLFYVIKATTASLVPSSGEMFTRLTQHVALGNFHTPLNHPPRPFHTSLLILELERIGRMALYTDLVLVSA